MTGWRKWRRIVALVLGLALLLSIFYFSWIPDPALERVQWLPRFVARWADHFDRLRTGVPFLFLGLLAGRFLLRSGSPLVRWAWVAGGLSLIGIVAELGQLFIPRRVCDWRDMAWAAAGSVVGLLPSAILRWRRGADSAFGAVLIPEERAGEGAAAAAPPEPPRTTPPQP